MIPKEINDKLTAQMLSAESALSCKFGDSKRVNPYLTALGLSAVRVISRVCASTYRAYRATVQRAKFRFFRIHSMGVVRMTPPFPRLPRLPRFLAIPFFPLRPLFMPSPTQGAPSYSTRPAPKAPSRATSTAPCPSLAARFFFPTLREREREGRRRKKGRS
jgi:hypothetical protein